MNISVIIPCYRAGLYLLEAVESVLQQKGNFNLLEILVIDDGSEDTETQSALKQVQLLPKVKLLRNERLKGSAGARNTGITQAVGEWIVFLDADDWLVENSIENRCAAARKLPAAEWIAGDFVHRMRDGSEAAQGYFHGKLDSYPFLKQAYEQDSALLLPRPVAEFLQMAPTNTIVAMVKKSLLQKVGMYNETLLRQQDYHLFLRLAAVADFVFVPRVVAKYRLHDFNSTKSLTLTQTWRAHVFALLESEPAFHNYIPLLRWQAADLFLGNSYIFRQEGKFFAAMCASLRSLRIRPTNKPAWRSLAAALLCQN